MLPRDRSVTTSSKSATSKPYSSNAAKAGATGLDTPVQFVKGVGPRLGAVFNSRDIRTVKDLMTFFPRAYEDRTQLVSISQMSEGASATAAIEITGSRTMRTRGGRTILEARARDATGAMTLKWFNTPRGLAEKFIPGTKIIVTGLVKTFMGRPEIVHPEITWNASTPDSSNVNAGRIVPVYVEIEGVPSRTFRKILWEALTKYGNLWSEDLPARLREAHALPAMADAVRSIHFPEETAAGAKIDTQAMLEFNTPAHWRLVYEEFLKFEYLVLKQRLRMEKLAAEKFPRDAAQAAVESLRAKLPFSLTGDQNKAIEEILGDLSEPHPMNRLIQGDVGSGKTAVALLASGAVLAAGGQVALMAPTEILAEQHYKNAQRLFGGKLNCALLVGKSTAAERAPLLSRLAAGEPMLLIGTHALIEDPVIFKNLAFVLIDEQHRFGVEQRRALKTKGVRERGGTRLFPHTLILTATPIPRTLALTAYGDLAVSTIQELPPGRSPVKTKVLRGDARSQAFEHIRLELKKGHQAYFIYPLVTESEAEGFTHLKNAIAEAERLQREVFTEFKVGLLHGQMRSEEKADVMDRFKRGEVHVLVSTTVVEVGVDVPNATVMAIEHAERFGLSQLHQLRGRVGRGSAVSYCFLFAGLRLGETTATRLEVLEETTDGFKIAEADLEIRGPGEFLGTRQAGGLAFRLAQLVRDREWLFKARDDAHAILQEDPDLLMPEHQPLRKYYEREGNLQFERLKTS